jgi:hypothetical protein
MSRSGQTYFIPKISATQFLSFILHNSKEYDFYFKRKQFIIRPHKFDFSVHVTLRFKIDPVTRSLLIAIVY